MIFIVGGFAQGKGDYARGRFENADAHILFLNSWAKSFFAEDKDPIGCIIKMVESDPDLLIISTEVGSGIVPLDREARAFRRKLGRLQCEVAKLAEEVVRVTSGIGVRIK